MTNARKVPDPSELEGAVLGTIARRGSCTAYQVRKNFRSSPTTSWRASAGAIYPLLHRLVKAGLLEERAIPGDGRGSKELRLTARGKEALKRWVSEEESWIGELPADPIRTRMQFMDLADVGDSKLLDQWIKHTKSNIERVEEGLRALTEKSGPHALAVYTGARMQLEARLEWLEGLRDKPSGFRPG